MGLRVGLGSPMTMAWVSDRATAGGPGAASAVRTPGDQRNTPFDDRGL